MDVLYGFTGTLQLMSRHLISRKVAKQALLAV